MNTFSKLNLTPTPSPLHPTYVSRNFENPKISSQYFLQYDTLQACASISVSKLDNFHLPYLVTFVNQFSLLFCP